MQTIFVEVHGKTTMHPVTLRYQPDMVIERPWLAVCDTGEARGATSDDAIINLYYKIRSKRIAEE